MNVRHMKRVAKRIKDNPETYEQGQWCGTAACVAGHGFFEAGGGINHRGNPVFQGKVRTMREVSRVGQEFLGLEEQAADALFMQPWPGKYNVVWTVSVPRQERAKVAYEYLMKLVRDHQRELKRQRDRRYRQRLREGKVVHHVIDEGEEAYREHTNPYGC